MPKRFLSGFKARYTQCCFSWFLQMPQIHLTLWQALWFILFHTSSQQLGLLTPVSSLRGWASGSNSYHRYWAQKVPLSFFPSFLCRSAVKSNLCLKIAVCMLFGDAVCLHDGWLDYGNVFFSGDWYHLGDDGEGQDERGAKNGLQCNKLFTVVNSQLPIWVYWLSREIVTEKQISSQMRCYTGGWIFSNKDERGEL